ncbi:MAG: LytTR family transcriptional regulator DNA-binding domain-containing protein, partial [Burkholderiales bacterium]|nr:LytTR family transcriptional regulator DNA-binding domain-containing protein [Burkholderiales bacterium]
EEFWQIHRAILVRMDAVEHVGRDIRGHQVVKVKGRDDRLEVSRSFSHLFRQM